MNEQNDNYIVLSKRNQNWGQPEIIRGYVLSAARDVAPESNRLSDVTSALWRRKFVIGAFAIAGVLIGLLVATIQKPVYRARTSLQIDGFNDSYFLRGVNPITPFMPNAAPDNYVHNQIKLLQSETLARRVADKLHIQPPRQNGSAVQKEEDRIRRVQNAINVVTSLQSQVLDVFYTAEDPELAARGANVAAEEFIELNRETRSQLAQDTTEWLSKQANDLRKTLDDQNRQLQDYVRSSGLVFTGNQSTLAEDRMRQLGQALGTAEAERAAKQARYEALLSSPPGGLVDGMAAAQLQHYETELQDLRRQLAEANTIYAPAHPKVKRLQAQISELEAGIASEKREVLSRMRSEYAAASGAERHLSKSHAQQMKEIQRDAERTVRYNGLKRDLETTQQMYDSMVQKVREAGVSSALRAVNVRVIDPAIPPSSPRTPNVPVNTAIGLAMGMFFGLAYTAVRERPDTSVRRPGDCKSLNIPELGVIPSAKDDRGLEVPKSGLLGVRPQMKDADLALVTWNEDRSLMSESFRGTVASILSSSNDARVFVVTSKDAMEGKTTVVTNLGIAFAEAKKRVLIIDADLRRPQLHTVFDICNDTGFSDVLQGGDAVVRKLQACIRATNVPDLYVLPSGPGTAAISRLIYSSEMDALLAQCRTSFDVVLVDCPPMAPYAEARVIGRKSDGVILVVRANRTSRDDVQDAYARLSEDGVPVLGCILNDWRMNESEARTYNNYYNTYENYQKPSRARKAERS